MPCTGEQSGTAQSSGQEPGGCGPKPLQLGAQRQSSAAAGAGASAAAALPAATAHARRAAARGRRCTRAQRTKRFQSASGSRTVRNQPQCRSLHRLCSSTGARQDPRAHCVRSCERCAPVCLSEQCVPCVSVGNPTQDTWGCRGCLLRGARESCSIAGQQRQQQRCCWSPHHRTQSQRIDQTQEACTVDARIAGEGPRQQKNKRWKNKTSGCQCLLTLNADPGLMLDNALTLMRWVDRSMGDRPVQETGAHYI